MPRSRRGGLAAEAAPYAWPSGDWAARPRRRRRSRAAGDGGLHGRRAAGAAPAAPAADPATLSPDQAFQEPLPPLDRPSLDAARRLLSAGGKIGGFVEGVLAEDTPAGQ